MAQSFVERTLLERLARPRTKGARSMTENTNELTRSVLFNLQKMLNSRIGHAPAQMDYGIPEPSEVAHAFPDALGQMQRAIRTCIEKYEPRLTGVNVMHVESEDDQFSLRFQITGQLSTSKDRTPVVFDTMVDAAGRIRLKS